MLPSAASTRLPCRLPAPAPTWWATSTHIHPYRVQILGKREIAYLTSATAEDCARRIARIVTLEPPVLVLADGQAAPESLLSMCERAQIPDVADARLVGLCDRRAAGLSVQALRPPGSRCTACSWDILGRGC